MSARIVEYSPSITPTHERRKQPLHNAVTVALELYLKQLGDHEPDKLYRMVIDEVERPLLECVLEHFGGNQTKAAKILGMNRSTLRKKLKYHGLS